MPGIKEGSSLAGIYIVLLTLALMFFGGFLHTRALFESGEVPLLRLQDLTLEGGKDDLGFRLIEREAGKEYRFTARFGIGELPPDNGTGAYRLILYRVSGNWIRVELNGTVIGTAGNMVNGRANIWNSALFMDIPASSLVLRNRLEIIINATHQLGGMPYPLYITDSVSSARLKDWFDFITLYSTLITQGVLAFSFVLFLLIHSSAGVHRRYEYLYFAGAALFMVINLTDYLPAWMMPVPYLLSKCLTLGALYLAIAFINYGVGRMFASRAATVMGFVMCGAILVLMLFFTSSAWRLQKAYSVTNLFILLSNIIWLVVAARQFRRSPRARTLFTAAAIMLIFAALDVSFIALQAIHYVSFTVFGAMFFSIGLSLLVVLDYMEIRIRLESESSLAEVHYRSSITDGLTGVYNKRYIMSQIDIKSMCCPFAVIMVDIDHFKKVNDTYGHEAGDEVIRYFASAAQEAVRKDDILGRYGGDEFLIVLPGCPSGQAVLIARRLQEAAAGFASPMFPPDFRFTLSIGVHVSSDGADSAHELIVKADKALYRSKKEGRDRITLFGAAGPGND